MTIKNLEKSYTKQIIKTISFCIWQSYPTHAGLLESTSLKATKKLTTALLCTTIDIEYAAILLKWSSFVGQFVYPVGGGYGVKCVVGRYRDLTKLVASITFLVYMQIWCNIQVIVFRFLLHFGRTKIMYFLGNDNL